ncbi:hypothetical protein LMG22037_05538 [Paraburkholderia phenoliruptrix]|uniref:Uncharacterized protein n=1 Tax=Paraburkholderia phenoliruptrix TaxID=252970 RepID=A0A6J5CBQ9_9BURK|nr:hypothetical protein [Paraburkholderia phenoliruptrix]CAB3730513.1 hypothetical protein LMG22037_05538 [Paraburkholderia phenoliruptrix]
MERNTAQITAFDHRGDVDHVFETRLQPFTELQSRTRTVRLYGDIEAPLRVELFDTNDGVSPPMAAFVPNDQGNYVRDKEDEESDHEYAFDIRLTCSLRFKAKSVTHAERSMRETLRCSDANLGEILGQTIVSEVSLDPDLPPYLYEVDGQPQN